MSDSDPSWGTHTTFEPSREPVAWRWKWLDGELQEWHVSELPVEPGFVKSSRFLVELLCVHSERP